MKENKRYLNCKYLDAGMDGMLCSRSLCTTCIEFNGKKCDYYISKNKPKKEKLLHEMYEQGRFDAIVDLEKNNVVIPKDEYRYIKDMANRFDPFWFCAFGGCEGACKECKDTCEMSIFVKERQKTAKDILNGLECFFWETAINDTKFFDLYQNLYLSIKEHIKNKYGVDAKEN